MSAPPRHLTVGFIGLGQMGAPMAANVLKSGYSLVAFDIDPGKVEAAVAAGAQPGRSPAEVARRAGCVLTMVSTTEQAEAVILGGEGVLSAAVPGDVVVSMSTVEHAAIKRIGEALAARGIDLIDAPVSGMEKGAREGTLKAFVGAEGKALDKARSILESMTSEITHCGPVGHGTAMKLVNNLLVMVGWVAVAEALALGTKSGLDPTTMYETISRATGNSVAFQYSAPRILARNFEGIPMHMGDKDMELMSQLARSVGMPLPITTLARTIYQMGCSSGLGQEDVGAALIKVYEQFAGVTVEAS